MSVQAGMAAPADGRWPKVYIVLVNWNGWVDTVECLESVFRLDYPRYEVLVCDNASGDGSLEHIEAWARGDGGTEVRAQNPALAHLVGPLPKPIALQRLERAAAERGEHAPAPSTAGAEIRLRLIPTGANLGFAGGNNVGIRHALQRGDAAYVWLLNNDTVVEPGALKALVQRAREGGDRGIVGSTLVFYHQPDKLQAMGGATLRPERALSVPIGTMQQPASVAACSAADVEARMSYVIGASMLVPRSFIDHVGLMEEDYFLYFEELDWALRGRKNGYALFYAPGSVVYHKVGASTDRNKQRQVTATVRYAYVNRLKFTARYFPAHLARVRLRMCYEAMRETVRGNWAVARYVLGRALSRVAA